jgi:hypothetical protein
MRPAWSAVRVRFAALNLPAADVTEALGLAAWLRSRRSAKRPTSGPSGSPQRLHSHHVLFFRSVAAFLHQEIKLGRPGARVREGYAGREGYLTTTPPNQVHASSSSSALASFKSSVSKPSVNQP